MRLLLGFGIDGRTYGTASTLLCSDVYQRPANRTRGLAAGGASGSRDWKPARTVSAWMGTWFLFDLWNQAAGRVSGFHPQGRLLWVAFVVWVVTVIQAIAWLTETTFREVLFGTPDREPRMISLGLRRPEGRKGRPAMATAMTRGAASCVEATRSPILINHSTTPDRKEVSMTTNMHRYAKPVVGLVLLLTCSLAVQASAPAGSLLAGSKPGSFEVGVDAQAAYDGHPSAYLKAKVSDTGGFGTLMQDFRADKYVAKRLRFSAFVKSDGIQSWAGLWMRVDKEKDSVAFDNMMDRPIKATTDWQRYEVVLGVPQDATGIFFGVLLDGTGEVWLNSAKIEVVGTDVATTGGKGSKLQDGPTNSDFEKP